MTDFSPTTFTIQGNWQPHSTQPHSVSTVALFASAKTPGAILLKTHTWGQAWRRQPVTLISGFHSPAEQEVWAVLWGDIVDVRQAVPQQATPRLIKVLARGMVKRFSAQEHHALSTGQLAVVSPFSAGTKRATKETAFRRNLVAASLAERVMITHAERGSQTWALAETVLGWGKPVFTFDHPQNEGLLGLGCGNEAIFSA